MSKKEDEEMAESGHDEPEELPEESNPEGAGSPGVTSAGGGAAAPRLARFDEDPARRPARQQRASSGGPGGGGGPRDGFFGRVGKFLREVRAELGRVTWPPKVQVRNTTVITIIAVIFFAAYLWAVDHAFAFLVEQIQRWVGAA